MTRNKIILPLFIIILLGLLTSFRLFRPGYFSMQDDVQVFRLQQLDLCLKDGQIPCRFIRDGGLGYGYPLYNYYSPLPYYIGEIFHLFGLSYIDSIKSVFILANFLAAIGIYLFANVLFGQSGALISTSLYTLAPYRALDAYVRGAIAELLAISLIPYLFYFASRKNKPALTVFIALILTCHNLFALVTIPLLLIYLYVFFKKQFTDYFAPIITGFGISAFFVIPAILEKHLVTVDTMTQGYFYYVNHFATLYQLFISRFWGYGASLWGPQDDMSFQVGLLQWLIPLLVLVLVVVGRNVRNFRLVIFFSLISVGFLFLTHSRSTFIWQFIPLLAYFQFPWRFLGFAIFGLSIISGAVISCLPNNKWQKHTAIATLLLTIILNIPYFREDIWYPKANDTDKLTGSEMVRQSAAGLMDYWPKGGSTFPSTYSPLIPEISPAQSATILNYRPQSNMIFFDATVTDNTHITIPTVYFPNWRLLVDGQPSTILPTTDLGLISFALPPGDHHINLIFSNTPIRSVSNTISLLTVIFFIISQVISHRRNVVQK